MVIDDGDVKIRWRFRETIEECTPPNTPPVRIADIFWQAKLSHGTLSDIWNGVSKRADLKTLERLLSVLRAHYKPDATVSDILELNLSDEPADNL